MAKGFKHGASSAGAGGVNFSVTGGTQAPASPGVNTIWVNTGETVTGWVFAASEPAEPAPGMVWIAVGTASTAAFNVLKKNAVYVYPVSCRQYVGGVWTDVYACIYQGGHWVQFSEVITDLYLYNAGDTCDAVTGGWSSYGNATLTLGESVMTIKGAGDYGGGGVQINNTLDLTGYNTIVFESTGTSDGYKLEVYNESGTAASSRLTSGGSIDISSLSGAYNIRIHCGATGSSGRTSTVSYIYLAK